MLFIYSGTLPQLPPQHQGEDETRVRELVIVCAVALVREDAEVKLRKADVLVHVRVVHPAAEQR